MQGLPDVLEQAMRVYAILGALLIVLIELELERLLWLFRFAEYWIGRSQIQVLTRCQHGHDATPLPALAARP